ncbi:MAG: peptidylprolyl isomerase [Alphaproteobacteria bacterium]
MSRSLATYGAKFVLALALPMFALSATAQDQAAPQAPISPETQVAVVNGQILTVADMELVFETLQPQYQRLGLSRVYPQLVERLVEQTLMVQAARTSGMDKTPAFQKQLRFIEDSMLERGFLDQQFSENIDQAALTAAYDAFEPPLETEASHILVAEEAKANELVAELTAGADFTALAKEHSTGPSGPNGGQLGFFTMDRMVPPFAEAAFATEPGQLAAAPVKTQYGWHIIKVTNRRKAEKPPFEQMQEALGLQLQEKVLERALASLKGSAKIEVFDLNAPAAE